MTILCMYCCTGCGYNRGSFERSEAPQCQRGSEHISNYPCEAGREHKVWSEDGPWPGRHTRGRSGPTHTRIAISGRMNDQYRTSMYVYMLSFWTLPRAWSLSRSATKEPSSSSQCCLPLSISKTEFALRHSKDTIQMQSLQDEPIASLQKRVAAATNTQRLCMNWTRS